MGREGQGEDDPWNKLERWGNRKAIRCDPVEAKVTLWRPREATSHWPGKDGKEEKATLGKFGSEGKPEEISRRNMVSSIPDPHSLGDLCISLCG